MAKDDITNAELLGAINKGFTAVEEKIGEVKNELRLQGMRMDRVSQKVDSIGNRLDAEILRRADEHGGHENRIKHLEDTVAV